MSIHSCSYYCDRPECIKAQRDELVKRMEKADEPVPVAIDAKMQVILHRALMRSGKVITPPAAQPPRAWVGLTDDEIYFAIRPLYHCDGETVNHVISLSIDEYRAIEKALKEKNT